MTIDVDLDFLKNTFESQGFNHYGWAALERPMTMAYYKTWTNENYHAGMEYLKRHTEIKENPQLLLQKAKTGFVFGREYFKNQNPDFQLKALKVASYAKQQDYHEWFQQELNDLCQVLKEKFPEHEFVAFTDSKPVLERDLAYRSGLGWFGKNTCLIDQKRGSFFFIGEIYSTLEVTAKLDVHPDRCGTCTKCIDSCPTGALSERQLDSNKCISYWTIEAKTTPPLELRDKFEGWFYGCDICQMVCPWNQKVYKADLNMSLDPIKDRAQLTAEVKSILEMDSQNLKSFFKDTPMNRAKPWAHKRNAILIAAHFDLTELKQNILQFTACERLGEVANWALQKF